jgi:hypothetical protein
MMAAFKATILSPSPIPRQQISGQIAKRDLALSSVMFTRFIVSADSTGHCQIARGSAVRMEAWRKPRA